jgi:hypothetical protein
VHSANHFAVKVHEGEIPRLVRDHLLSVDDKRALIAFLKTL